MDIFLIIILKLYFQLKACKNTHFKLIVLVTYYFHILMINNITLYEMEKISLVHVCHQYARYINLTIKVSISKDKGHDILDRAELPSTSPYATHIKVI